MKAPLVVKWRYWKNTACRNGRSANYLSYIGIREGVEKFDDNVLTRKATKKQKVIIGKLTQAIPSIKNSVDYLNYENSQSRGCATELISSAFDDNPKLFDSKTYLDYIGTRPRVEKSGLHGLFSDEEKTLVMSEEREKLNNFDGIVHTLIVSLSREDAEACGFNNAQRWRAFMRTQKNEIAQRFGIPMESLQWYGAFHNESYHPHIHVLLYSTDQRYPGYISQKELTGFKSSLATDIFKEELSSYYKEQTKRRDELTRKAREKITMIFEHRQLGIYSNPQLDDKLTSLSEKLQGVKGKKVYGFLPQELKKLVDEITEDLAKDELINSMYNLWYECKCDISHSYTYTPQKKLPLSREPTFKPIKNAIIKEAMSLEQDMQNSNETLLNSVKAQEKSNVQHKVHTTSAMPTHQTKNFPLVAGMRLIETASQIIQNEIDNITCDWQDSEIDSRLKEEIEAKKKGQNMSM